MIRPTRKLSLVSVPFLFLAGAAFAQTSSLEGDVKGEDGAPLRGALVKIERQDIKGSYKVKTDKKGHFFHAGLPLGTYTLILEIDGKDRDRVQGVRTRLGDPQVVNFDLQRMKQRQDALAKAADTGQLTEEQKREMSSEQRAAMEKQMKERQQQLAKNKALNDAFNAGKDAMTQKNYQAAVEAFNKACEFDPKQHVVWASLADADLALAGTKTGAEADAAMAKAMESWNKAIELKPDDAAYHNNFALALVKMKKIPEAQAELTKAAQLDPQSAGKYYYNLGAVLTNIGQLDAAGDAFKKAIEIQPAYGPAQYQYGIFLMSKATTTPDGKIVPPPGAKEAFEKYLELEPNGPNADAAKGMLSAMSATIETEYKNPTAPAKKSPTRKK